MSDFNTLLAVRDLMTTNIVTALKTITVSDAAGIMADKNIGSVILTDEDGALAGIITENDIVVKVVAVKKDPSVTTVDEVMNSEIKKVSGGGSIFEARQVMTDLKIKHLIVEEDGKPVGLISATALLGS